MTPSTVPVLAVYALRKGADEARFRELLARHHLTLAQEKLTAVRAPNVMRSGNCFVEQVEWNSPESAETAHTNPKVKAIWGLMAELVDFIPLAQLPNADKPFAHFSREKPDLGGPNQFSDWMISAKDYAKQTEFYAKAFDLVETQKSDDFTMLCDTGSSNNFCITNGTSVDKPGPSFYVRDVEAETARLLGLGAKLIRSWSYSVMKGANLADPEGNEFMIFKTIKE
jgi:predicted enzyme related to lactoylglutathione lyase